MEDTELCKVLLRKIRTATPPKKGKVCLRGRCEWKRDGIDVCCLPVCMKLSRRAEKMSEEVN